MNKFLIALILAILFIPIYAIVPLGFEPVWYNQYLGLMFFLLLFNCLYLWDFNKYLSLFNIVCLFSAFFVTRFSPRAIILLFQLNLGCLVSYQISKFNKSQRKKILYAILIAVLFQLLWLIIQHFNLDPFFHSTIRQGKDEMVGFFGAKDQLGTFFALTAPILLNFHIGLALISLFGLFVSKSSFAFISAIIGILLYLWFKSRNIAIFTIIAMLIIGSVYFVKVDKLQFADFNTRFLVWDYAVKSTLKGNVTIEINEQRMRIKSNPIFGYGFGNFLKIFPYIPQSLATNMQFNYADEKFTHAHNDYVELFFELGLLGLISMVLLLFNFIRSFIVAEKSQELIMYFSTILIYILNSLGNFLAQIAISGFLLMIFYGLYEGCRREKINGEITKLV